MAEKKSTSRGAATEKRDYAAVSQESDLAKPTKEELAGSGYILPPQFHALEEAGGDPEQAAKILAESGDTPTSLDEQNAKADAVQREAMAKQGREYRVLGQKNAGGPAENKSAVADSEEETATRTRARASRSK